MTQDPFWVVTSDAEGAPGFALALLVAPIAPDPFVPVAFAPVNVTTVMEETTLCEMVAVTVTLVKAEGAKARQISAVPLCVLVRSTNTQVRPAPVMPVTVVFVPEMKSEETKASSSSLDAVVENAGVARVVLAAVPSL